MTPRTHKDHITLYWALDFLNKVFIALANPSGLTAEIVDLYNETLSAVLPAMGAYFSQHFDKANSFFVGMIAGRESDKEQAAAAHAVCSTYFQLLLTLSGSVYSSKAAPSILFAPLITGHCVLALLHHIVCSELHGTHDRALAVGILENLVRHHTGGWNALCCCCGTGSEQEPGFGFSAGGIVIIVGLAFLFLSFGSSLAVLYLFFSFVYLYIIFR